MFLPAYIDIEQSEKYVLSIRIQSDSFMFSIFDPNNKKNYCLRETIFSVETSLLENIKRIIFELNFLTQQFKQTNVVIVSSAYSLIPDSYLGNNSAKELYEFTNMAESEHLFADKIVKQNCTTLYSIENDIYEFLFRNLCNPTFYHHTSLLIDFFEDKGKAVSINSKMFVNFRDDAIDILSFTNSTLNCCLSYKNEFTNSASYYILKLWEQSGFSQLTDHLYIAGNSEETTMQQLHQYIKNIETIGAPSETFFWNDDMQKTPLDLLNLSL